MNKNMKIDHKNKFELLFKFFNSLPKSRLNRLIETFISIVSFDLITIEECFSSLWCQFHE